MNWRISLNHPLLNLKANHDEKINGVMTISGLTYACIFFKYSLRDIKIPTSTIADKYQPDTILLFFTYL